MADCDFLYLLFVAAGFFDHMLVVLSYVADGYSTGLAVLEVHSSGCDSSRLPVVLAAALLDFASHLPSFWSLVLASCCTCGVVHLLVCLALVADMYFGSSVGHLAFGFVLHIPEGLTPLACYFALHRFCFACYVADNDSPFPLVFQAH